MSYIKLTGLKFHSLIGHFDEEKIIGTNFNINIYIKVNTKKSAISDNLTDALNYVDVYELIKSEMEKKCNLVENATYRILKKLFLTFPQIKKIKIEVSKLFPKIGGVLDKVSIIKKISRKKFELDFF
jgi:dihydroneopterin aldolase